MGAGLTLAVAAGGLSAFSGALMRLLSQVRARAWARVRVRARFRVRLMLRVRLGLGALMRPLLQAGGPHDGHTPPAMLLSFLTVTMFACNGS